MNDDFLRSLRQACDEVLSDAADCWPYGSDYSRIHHPPDAVAFPGGHEQVLNIVRLCNEHAVPLTARGGGTATTGAAVPVRGGVVLSTARMDAVRDCDARSRTVVAQPGAKNRAVQEFCARKGLFWPPDPGSATTSTVGGNLACNAGGPRAVKYGATRDNVLGLKAVSGGGDEIVCGSSTTKHSAGLDLTRLLVGSEGRLAVITEATLKLSPVPLRTHTMLAEYDSIENASAAVATLMSQPATPCALELMDAVCVRLTDEHLGKTAGGDGRVCLLIQADGTEAGADSDADAIGKVCAATGCLSFTLAGDADEAEALWEARRALSPALRRVAPSHLGEDFVVPVSRLAHFVRDIHDAGERHGVPVACFGHAGNGNLHVNLMYDPDDEAAMRAVQNCVDELVDTTLKHGGSLSGEHGIGLHKRDFVARQIPAQTLEMLRRIKRVFDPNGVLNPGKQTPDAPSEK